MFRIALCEDDNTQRKQTYNLLNSYISAQNLAAGVHVFPSGRELPNAMLDTPFDIYLLAVVMPGMNGLELGMQIRQTDREGFPIAPNTSHGLGSRSVAAYCEKHDASCEYRTKDGWFTIQIVQPIWTT